MKYRQRLVKRGGICPSSSSPLKRMMGLDLTKAGTHEDRRRDLEELVDSGQWVVRGDYSCVQGVLCGNAVDEGGDPSPLSLQQEHKL